MMLSAFEDSILFQNLAAWRAWKKILKNSQTMLISAAVNTSVHTCMSVNIAGIQRQKMKNDTWELGLRKTILEYVSRNNHVSNKSCFYLHVWLDIVVPGGHRLWSHLKWYKTNSYQDKWGLFAEKLQWWQIHIEFNTLLNTLTPSSTLVYMSFALTLRRSACFHISYHSHKTQHLFPYATLRYSSL